jgi:hypothetical protein
MVVAAIITPVFISAPMLGPAHVKSELVQFVVSTPVVAFHADVPLAVCVTAEASAGKNKPNRMKKRMMCVRMATPFIYGTYTDNVITAIGPVESFRDAITAWEAPH